VPTEDPHNLQPVVHCDNNNDFNKVVSNLLINKMYQGALSGATVTLDASAADMYSALITSAGWTPSGDNYISNIKHDLLNEWPIVQLMKVPKGEVIVPNTIKSISNRRTVVEVAEIASYQVTIIG
jgi:hypothetical protein